MTRSFRTTLVAATAALVLVAGCEQVSPNAPAPEDSTLLDVKPGKSDPTGSGNDTTRNTPTPPTTPSTPPSAPDTGSTPTPNVNVSIRGLVYRAGSGVPTDTGAVSTVPPLAGVRVRLMLNRLVNGQATQTVIATVTSGADGRWSVASAPAGYYVVEGLRADGSVAAYSLLHATQPVNVVNVWMP